MARNRNGKTVNLRFFRCPDCGNMMSAGKAKVGGVELGHVKDMWCPWCRAMRQFELFDKERIQR